jgi:hypothetical protein
VTSADIVQKLGDGVVAGIPVDRISAFVMTLHPDVWGRWFRWQPGSSAEVGQLSYEIITKPHYINSPIGVVVRDKLEVRRRIADPAGVCKRFRRARRRRIHRLHRAADGVHDRRQPRDRVRDEAGI